jgi:hypothetical protein
MGEEEYSQFIKMFVELFLEELVLSGAISSQVLNCWVHGGSYILFQTHSSTIKSCYRNLIIDKFN